MPCSAPGRLRKRAQASNEFRQPTTDPEPFWQPRVDGGRDEELTIDQPRPKPEPLPAHRTKPSSAKQRLPATALKKTDLPRNEYEHMPIEDDEFRLMLLHPAKVDEPLRCTLQTVTLRAVKSDRILYDALSYSWGMEDPARYILMNDMSSGSLHLTRRTDDQRKLRKFYIRESLNSALRRLRSNTGSLYLWVDAICINQEDEREQDIQIGKMTDIYQNAFNVRIWLGEETDPQESIHATEFIARALDLSFRSNDLVAETTPLDGDARAQWEAFATVLRSPWFERRWAISELACARFATLQYGGMEIAWTDFSDAVSLVSESLKEKRTTPQMARILYKSGMTTPNRAASLGTKRKESPGLLSEPRASRIEPHMVNARLLATEGEGLVRKSYRGNIIDRLYSIEHLVINWPLYDVGNNPRDFIYALLPIAKDGPNSKYVKTRASECLFPDYQKHPLDVYIEFVKHAVSTSHRLDIICRHWARPIHEEAHVLTTIISLARKTAPRLTFPSWILSLDVSTSESLLSSERRNAESLLGMPNEKPRYSACNDLTPDVTFGVVHPSSAHGSDATRRFTIPRYFSGSLVARGVSLDKIKSISPRAIDANIPREVLEMGGWRRGEPQQWPEPRLWKTLVADRGPDRKSAPHFYSRALLHCLEEAGASGDIDPRAIIAGPVAVMDGYLTRLQSATRNRKFFLTSGEAPEFSNLSEVSPQLAQGFFGFGSEDIEEGDIVCILLGCSVPVILNEQIDGNRKYYRFKGECYVHGVMKGELLKSETVWRNNTKFFELR